MCLKGSVTFLKPGTVLGFSTIGPKVKLENNLLPPVCIICLHITRSPELVGSSNSKMSQRKVQHGKVLANRGPQIQQWSHETVLAGDMVDSSVQHSVVSV